MNIFQVRKLINNTIIKELKSGNSLDIIVSDINKRKTNISNLLRKELNYNDNLYNKVVSCSNIDNYQLTKRAQYAFYYVKEAESRIEKLKWVDNNKGRFKSFKNQSILNIFNLTLLKEELIESSYKLPFK
jgi:hypothetical protein